MLCVGVAQAYEHEVWQSGSLYYWKTFNVERGSSSDLATAINGCLGSGNREIHILCGGSLYSTIRIPGNSTKIYGHNNSFAKNHNELGVSNGYNGFELYDFTLTGGTSTSQHGIRSTGASNLRFVNVKVLGSPWIGIRIDSKSSEAWTAWVSNLYMENITVENCGSHGVETYSIDGVDMYGMVARNCGDCGVLNNRCEDINIGTIDAYRCAVNNHYAGYRQANDCGVARINRIVSNQCGRGIYIMGGSRDTEINSVDVRDCYYRGITTGDTGSNPVRVNSGTVTGTAGGYDIDIWDPTNVCIRVNGTTYGNACGSSGITGTKKIINRASGKGMDAGGNSNGS
ncbi:right-handed parallel beta-helix repeat-containing protein, partial [Candidatus Sumerlaeota bacterium]|nr:right-handed parallel beta-helix repeat-containing protein [Candidatus Sumerlaeota bacterium]